MKAYFVFQKFVKFVLYLIVLTWFIGGFIWIIKNKLMIEERKVLEIIISFVIWFFGTSILRAIAHSIFNKMENKKLPYFNRCTSISYGMTKDRVLNLMEPLNPVVEKRNKLVYRITNHEVWGPRSHKTEIIISLDKKTKKVINVEKQKISWWWE